MSLYNKRATCILLIYLVFSVIYNESRIVLLEKKVTVIGSCIHKINKIIITEDDDERQ